MNIRRNATDDDLARLKSMRLEAGWTPEQVANEVLYVSPRTYYRWESGVGNMKRVIFESFEQKVKEAVNS